MCNTIQKLAYQCARTYISLMPVRDSITALKDEAAEWRRELHRHPQTAYEEEFASGFVAGKLSEWGIPFERGIAKTGIVATIEGKQTDSGKSVALRADMDALDITEDSGQPWCSTHEGKMHACGHDGHTTMLLSAAKYLSENRDFNGTAYLIFQPAEEGGAGGKQGAERMIAEGLFEKFPADAVYGMHNWPPQKKGTIGLRAGPMMASTNRFNITVHGKGGHAALPHLTVDPVMVSAQIITALQTLVSRTADPLDAVVISVTNISAGTGAYNIIPQSASFYGTLRTLKEETRQHMKERIGEMSRQVAQAFGASIDYDFVNGLFPTVNDAACAAFCAEVARKVVGDENTYAAIEPSMGAEDFGAMLMEKPGCYVFLGQGEPDRENSPHNHMCHSPHYDFNDDAIPLGVEYWVTLVETALA